MAPGNLRDQCFSGAINQTLGERIPGRISPLGMTQKSSMVTVGVVTTAGGKLLLFVHALRDVVRARLVLGKPR